MDVSGIGSVCLFKENEEKLFLEPGSLYINALRYNQFRNFEYDSNFIISMANV